MSKESKKQPKHHKKWLVIFLLLLIISSLVLYSRFISTSGLKINEIKIVNQKIPNSFYGTKIVHFTDIHFGTTVKTKQFEHLIEKIKILKPDILIFTGDLINKNYNITKDEINILTSNLNSIDSSIGKYAILGEDDKNNNNTLSILNEAGFIILKNESDIVYNKSNSYISISGFDLDNPTTKEMVLGENNFNILITHKGDYLKEVTNVDLALGGHSHNNQIQIPFIGSLYKKNGSKIYSKPYYKVNTTDIYISNGIGTADYNFRFCNRPSVNFFRLVNK